MGDQSIIKIDSVDFISVGRVLKLIGKDNEQKKRVNTKRELEFIKRVPNVRKETYLNKIYFAESDILDFLDSHISKSEIINLVGIKRKKLIDKLIKERNVSSYILGIRLSQVFYPKEEIYTVFSDYLGKVETATINVNNAEYINIYRFAKLLGRDPDTLKCSKTKNRFKNYLSDIINLKTIKLDGEILYHYNDVSIFLEDFISKKDAVKLLNVSVDTFDKYIKEKSLKVIFLGNSMDLKFYPRKDINNLVEGFSYDKSIYMSIYDIADLYFQRISHEFINELKENIKTKLKGVIKEIKLTRQTHDTESGRYIYSVYCKKDVISFFDNYIRKSQVIESLEQVASSSLVKKIMNEYSFLPTINLGKNLNSIFYSNNDSNQLLEAVKNELELIQKRREGITYIDGEAYYSRTKTMEILKLGYKVIKKIEGNELVIDHYQHQEPFFHSKEVEKFLVELNKELENIRINYYTIEQIKEKYNQNYIAVIKNKNNKVNVEYKELSILLRSWLNSNGGHVYKKYDVDTYWDYYLNGSVMNSITLENPFEEFVYKTEQVLKMNFLPKMRYTKKLWYENVEKVLIKSNRTNTKELIHLFVRSTETIIKTFKKEIFYYTAQEINKKFLNSSTTIPRNQQRQFYKFLRRVTETFNLQKKYIPIDIKLLNNPAEYETYKEADNSIYTLEEYHDLYNYCNQIDFHKANALSDVLIYLRDLDCGVKRPRYKKYDSVWLYVLVQLTNNWRHNTVITQIPRIDLSKTRISSLAWLGENNPSIEEANDIIFQIGRYVQHIHKTNVNSEGVFTIGEPLKIAFATAIAICELRTQITDNDSEILIKLSLGKDFLSTRLTPNRNPYNIFFSDFKTDIIFENRKLNRTLTTLIWSVLRSIGRGLKEAQLSRVHKNEQTTINHYIKLNQEQVNKLVMDLFEKKNFGFVTQLFNKILFGQEENRNIETQSIINTSKNFGSPIKIEATSGLINKLAQEKESVLNYLANLKGEELWNLYLNSIAGNLPSKERYFQCVYSQCKYEDEFGNMPDCKSCGAAIINVYALSQIMDNYVDYLNKIANDFENLPMGERKRLANHFHLIYKIVNEARNTFGRHVIYGFVKGGEAKIKSLGKIVSSKKITNLLTVT